MKHMILSFKMNGDVMFQKESLDTVGFWANAGGPES